MQYILGGKLIGGEGNIIFVVIVDYYFKEVGG